MAFEYNGRESFIPTGAMCATRPGFGPGTPCYEDAPAGFEEALTILDFTPAADGRRAAALDTILAGAVIVEETLMYGGYLTMVVSTRGVRDGLLLREAFGATR